MEAKPSWRAGWAGARGAGGGGVREMADEPREQRRGWLKNGESTWGSVQGAAFAGPEPDVPPPAARQP
jgi:hypothetical protein